MQSEIEFLNNDDFLLGRDMPNAYRLPDGTFTFFKASDQELEVLLRINDITIPEYHKNNGVTKLALKKQNSRSYTTPVDYYRLLLFIKFS